MKPEAKPAKHSAAGQYLGYALQPVRFCYHLLTCTEGSKVSLEYLDDVSILQSDGTLILEQDKSALSQNPLSDWAPDLWKALANWLDQLSYGDVEQAHTRFQLYVTPAKNLGDFAQRLNNAQTNEEAQKAAEHIAKSFANLEKAPSCKKHVEKFLQSDSAVRLALIKQFLVISTDDDPLAPLQQLFKCSVSNEHIDLICKYAIGSAKEKADRLIRNGLVATISCDDFRAETIHFIQKNNLPGLLLSYSEAPDTGDIDELLTARPTFVEQLDLIDLDPDSRIRAVSDYLRTAADISIWGERGLLFQNEQQDWDDDLTNRYVAIAGEIEDTQPNLGPEARGRTVYRRCSTLQPTLNGRAVPSHFVCGSFNALADECRVGWHPEYKAILGILP